MNASETPVPAATAPVLSPVTSIVVGPLSTSLSLSQLATGAAHSTVQVSGTVNMQNAESGVSLHVGERFLLDLGERGWNIRSGDTELIAPVPDVPAPVGSQGYYQGVKAGMTKLYATSDPPCRQSKPPCLLPTLFLEINVTILP